ncbi:TPA: hypothetical protein N2C02_006472 [Pseudomonas aeruginosa]|uniref:hypothetical protein n=1 Tax=Pseudomonas TaxID=286 RepID=UPI0002A3A225|nr:MULTISPECIES: hypothetical protein [Pseudomonas]MBB1605419.1 hypothetical protein [Pseudomonas sp. UMC76]MBB1641364.1 hypothetical protein [Pseudomonas sp. UME83]MBF3003385.1 hypothetical protein [Pseudomonas aeruginosa]MBF3194870.1 hypothetical protein [Pseudomonas aeruginosa]MBF3213334.1 hypothetical protein [Pseudomonas aeruginosa]
MSPHETDHDFSPHDDGRDEIVRDIARTATAVSSHETVQRFGSANAEYIKGYTGVDNETGQRFAKGLADIAKHKVNDDPRYAVQNIKQQAGFSAEVATTSRDNAEAIISGSKVRTSRTDDLPQFGKNHNVVDRVQLLDGQIIEGSQSQMKFVGNRNQLLDDIAREDGKFARYRDIRLELPSEQFEGDRTYFQDEAKRLRERAEQAAKDPSKTDQARRMRLEAEKIEQRATSADFQPESASDYCRKQAQQRRANAAKAEANGNSEAAAKLNAEADNYENLADKVSDSGLSTEDAIYYREHPGLATLQDIGRTAHRAGVEGARFGAVIGGSISLLQNCLAAAQGEKDLAEILKDISVDTAKAGAFGYATAFAGSALKGGMQQSGNAFVRQLANTSAPTLVINICISLGGSVKRYVTGEISEAQLLSEVGEKGAGMLSSGMMAALGQLAIPVPFVGAAIGGMIGYTLSSMFYQSALDAARGVELSREQLARVRFIEEAARERIALEQAQLDDFIRREIPQLQQETQQLLSVASCSDSCVDVLAARVNQYATLLGKQLQFQTQAEFDDFMSSGSPLIL